MISELKEIKNYLAYNFVCEKKIIIKQIILLHHNYHQRHHLQKKEKKITEYLIIINYIFLTLDKQNKKKIARITINTPQILPNVILDLS